MKLNLRLGKKRPSVESYRMNTIPRQTAKGRNSFPFGSDRTEGKKQNFRVWRLKSQKRIYYIK